MLHSLLLTGALWIITLLLMMSFWPVLRMSISRRRIMLGVWSIAIFALPLALRFWQPDAYIILQVWLTLTCAMMPLRLHDAHISATWWKPLPFAEWYRFISHPFVLVWKRHGEETLPPRKESMKLFVRSLLEIILGLTLFFWALQHDFGERGFWLEHTIKLIAAYLFGFDGLLTLMTALCRLGGSPVMEVSRHPILAVTPADFWRRYNRNPGQYFYEDVFKPLGGRRHPLRGIFGSFFLSGLYHEYILWVLTGRFPGYLLAYFLLHGLAVMLSFRFRPTGSAALFSWLATFIFHILTTVLFFTCADMISPGWFYNHGSPLP